MLGNRKVAGSLGLALGGLAVCTLLGPSAEAQTLIHRWDGSAGGDQAGRSLGGGFDVDADGVPDVLVGMPTCDLAAVDGGAVRVCSGATGGELFLLSKDQAGAQFGSAVATVGDLDGDGHAEFLVGAPLFDTGSIDCGRAWLYSGQNGLVITNFTGS